MSLFGKSGKNHRTVDNNSIDMSEYMDVTPGYTEDCYPDCPLCGTQMGYSSYKEEFKCPNCGHIMSDENWEFDMYDENGMPWGCSACGGPWPDCMSSCKLFDD